MEKFIRLIGLDSSGNRVYVSVNVEKISFMREIDSNGSEELSTRIYFSKDLGVSVTETVDQVEALINELNENQGDD